MKKGLIGLLSLLVVGVLTGCGGGAPEPDGSSAPVDKPSAASDASAEGSGTTEPAPMKEEADGHGHDEKDGHGNDEAAKDGEGSDDKEHDHAAMKDKAAEAPAVVDGLVGTKWVYNEIELTFKDDKMVALKGGPLAAIEPDGLDAEYTIVDGVFEVSVMGTTYSGTYADGKLTVDGTEAVKQQ